MHAHACQTVGPVNSECSLNRSLSSSRLCRMRPETPCPAAEALADRAKALIVAHLALPSLDIVYSLLLLAYHEHGADRDSGLWAYSGMAIRACIDMGLHKVCSRAPSRTCSVGDDPQTHTHTAVRHAGRGRGGSAISHLLGSRVPRSDHLVWNRTSRNVASFSD